MRRLSMLLTGLSAGLTLALQPALAQGDLGLIDKGKLVWGTSATFPPFEYMEEGKPAGFDVDLVDAMLATLKLQSSPSVIEFKGLIPAILGGRIDAIISGMYINPQRQEVIDFVPYMRVGNQLLVAKGNPLHVAEMIDLCGHRVAAPVGTVYEKSARALAEKCQSTGKAALTLLSLTSTATSALALKEGRVDALIAAVPVIVALMHDSPDAFATAGKTFDNDTLLGIGVRKDRPALKQALDTALKDVVHDGTYAALLKKYGLPQSTSLF